MKKKTKFGKQLLKLLVDRDMNAADLARGLGVSQSYVNKRTTQTTEAMGFCIKVSSFLELSDGDFFVLLMALADDVRGENQ